MKTRNLKNLIICIGLSTILCSCDKKQVVESKPFLNGELNAKSSKIAQEYSKNNEMISLSAATFMNAANDKTKDEDQGKIRAILYRFYKHVKVENGKLTTNVKNGSEINISDELFNILYKDINNSNRKMDSLKNKGVKIEFPEVTDEYLNSLISN